MRVDLHTIDRERFRVEERDGLTLVGPRKAMFSWRPGELHLRSLLCRPDGAVVSAGFPKFFNFGEDDRADREAERLSAGGRMHYREKLDGTLIIRSVVDGQAHFRTRGSHTLGTFEEGVMPLIRQRHAVLLDPTYQADRSLLMEYTAPTNQIVIRYDEAELWALAEVVADGRLHVFESTFHHDAEMLSAPRRLHVDQPLHDAERHVSRWMQGEGVVAWMERADGSHHLLKMKAAEYKRLHSLRSQLTEVKTWALCAAAGASSLDGGRRALAAHGLDWETFQFAEPWIKSYLARRLSNDRTLDAARRRMRKAVALAAKDAAEQVERPELFPVLLNEAIGEREKAARARRAADVGMSANKTDALIRNACGLDHPDGGER